MHAALSRQRRCRRGRRPSCGPTHRASPYADDRGRRASRARCAQRATRARSERRARRLRADHGRAARRAHVAGRSGARSAAPSASWSASSSTRCSSDRTRTSRSYPRTLEPTSRSAQQHGVDLVYAPTPRGDVPAGLSDPRRGRAASRSASKARRGPTHFRGVTTVVTKLFNAVGPCVAVFGRKDYQQWRVLERMARDLAAGRGGRAARPCASPTASRCRRAIATSIAEQRARALAITRGLRAADAAYRAGERARGGARGAGARADRAARSTRIDYVSRGTPRRSSRGGAAERPACSWSPRASGTTRLIDNAVLGQDALR